MHIAANSKRIQLYIEQEGNDNLRSQISFSLNWLEKRNGTFFSWKFTGLIASSCYSSWRNGHSVSFLIYSEARKPFQSKSLMHFYCTVM